ncbi:MAG: SpaA isopeptide-forming pilin-related protein, partial [Lachnospiraceae bacterium]
SGTDTYTRASNDVGVEYTTDSDGYIHIPIQQTGAYELVETEAATGYELGTTPFDCFFSVKDSDLRQKLDITSKTAAPKDSLTSEGTQPFFVVQSGTELLTAEGVTNVRKTGTLTINKKDGATNAALDGVKFMLYKQNSDGSYGNGWEFTTGKKYKAFDSVKYDTPGVTTLEDLPWGNYKLVETTALDGYIRNTAEYLFTVSKDNVSNPIELKDISSNVITDNDITNNRNKIQFIKQSDDAEPVNLTGGIYRIVKVSGISREEVSFYTDAAGATGTRNRLTAGDTAYGLAAGTYEIEELTAPDGYKLNSAPMAFVMDEYGNAKKADNTPWSDNQIIMQDAPVKIALKKTDSSTGLAVTGAVFKLSGIFAENGNRASGESTIVDLTVDNFTEKLKGKLIASTGEKEGVDCFTYCLEETTAPVGYNLLVEPIKFRLSAAGEIVLVQAPAMVTVNNRASVPEINVRNSTEECSFVVTKEFVQDDIWKNSIRPSQISLQLYAQIEGTSEKQAMGNPVVLDITTDVDSYTHTYNNLPVYHYDNDDGASVPKKIKYSVEETDVKPEEKAVYYRIVYSTVTESGRVYSQTITNTAADLYPTGSLKIGKTNIGGAMNAMFRIKVTISRDGKETAFLDTYEVYKSDDDNNDSNDVLLRTESASEGYV